jgi:hypothetical protein
VEVPNEEEQENRDDALNAEDSENEYMAEDDKERVISEQINSFREMNELINAQRFGTPGVANLESNNSSQPGSHL